MALTYLGLGSNIENREFHLRQAILNIDFEAGEVLAVSSFYETEPWGFISDNKFLNAAILLKTLLPPEDLLHALRNIEKKMGRDMEKKGSYTDRVIDIDILFYDNKIIKKENLQIPHNYISKRLFVLAPLNEIAPDFIHPENGETIHTLYQDIKKHTHEKVNVFPYENCK